MGNLKVARWAVAYETLKHQIQSLELAPGAHLSENGIAEQLGMSASPVRDALGRLSQEGLIAVRRGQGYTVANLTIGSIGEICDLRYILESGAIRLSIARARPEELADLEEKSRHVDDVGIEDTERIRRNCEFHVDLAKLSQNAKLVDSVRRVMDESVRIFHLGLPAFMPHGMHENHEGLINAIRDRDEAAAIALCYREAFETSQSVLEKLLHNPDQRMTHMLSMDSAANMP